MTDTSSDVFHDVTQSNLALIDWVNPVFATAVSDGLWANWIPSAQYSEVLQFYNPRAQDEVPTGATIDAFLMVVRCAHTVSGGNTSITGVKITDGTLQTDLTVSSTITNRTVYGTVAQWGLTQAEAWAFINGDSGKYFECQGKRLASFADDQRIYSVKCRISYTPAPGSGLLLGK